MTQSNTIQEITSASEVYCLGLRSTRSRGLTPDEHDGIRRGIRRTLMYAALLSPVSGGFGAAILWSGWNLAQLPPGFERASGLLWTLVFAVGAAVSGLWAWEEFQRARLLQRDEDIAIVLCFEGAPGAMAAAPVTLRRFRQVKMDTDAPLSLEALSGSGRIWQVNGSPVTSWVRAPLAVVARPPEMGLWETPGTKFAGSDGISYIGVRRGLSEAEGKELLDHARRAVKGWPVFPFAAAFTAGMWSWWSAIKSPVYLAAGIAGLALLGIFVRSLWFGWRMYRDAWDGWVWSFRPLSQPDEQAYGPPSPGPTNEVLPHTRLPWVWAGETAPWRIKR